MKASFVFFLVSILSHVTHAASSESIHCLIMRGGPSRYSEEVTIDRSALKTDQPNLPFLSAEISVKDVELTVMVEKRGSIISNLTVIARVPELGNKRISAAGHSSRTALTIYADANSPSRDFWCSIK